MSPIFNVQYLKGVGPRKAEILKKLNIQTVHDLMFYFPRKWEDRRLNSQPALSYTDFISPALVLCGKVISVRDLYTSTNLRIFKAILSVNGNEIEADWYKQHNPHYDVFAVLRKHIKPGSRIWIIGKADDPLFKTKIRVEEYYPWTDEKARLIHVDRIVPVYPLTEGLNGKLMRELVYKSINEFSEKIQEILPQKILSKRHLMPINQAIKFIHFPQSYFELKESLKRFIYEELFLMSLAWAIKRRQIKKINKGFSYEIKRHLLTPFKQNLGFEFTSSQKRVINEIFKDMQSSSPMTRLLQGDVGSGKTVVAISALLLAVENNYQGVFMAPTEILAEQHFITFTKFLKNLAVKFALLTSKTPKKEKDEIIKKVANGEIDILISTHSVLEKTVQFKNLKIIVIDEQHRFGVRQRAALRQKGNNSDMLVMTATPIPRTLFLSLYGDLDLSILKEMPPGRKPVQTLLMDEEKSFEEIRKEVLKGRQVYVVYPIIEESNERNLKSVKKEFERLSRIFKKFRIGMIHGQLPGNKKEKIMEEFSSHKLDILVATPVIEVGIDVPNATLMLINNAEQFGLADLHQLRGRVGRGEFESKCILTADCKTDDARKRIETICSTNNGFEISETDIYIRGAGDILGIRQHGDMEFKIADISRDSAILKLAIEDRDEILRMDFNLLKPENQPLKRELFRLYQEKWNIIDLS